MTFRVYPDPPVDPLSLNPGATSAPVTIDELFGSAGGNSTMFIRYVLVGGGCAPPMVSLLPAVFLIADGTESEITSLNNVNPTRVAGGRAFATVFPPGAGGRAVFRLEVSKFTPDVIAWRVRFRNNDAVAHQLTWVVADSDAESRQPWMELPHRADWPTIGGVPAGQVEPLTVQVANKGTGNLVIRNTPGPVGATGFALSAPLPPPIAPNACGDLTFSFTVPAVSGTRTASFTAVSNDSSVPPGSTTASHNGQLELVAEVGVPRPVFNASPNQFDPQQGVPGDRVTLFGRNFDTGELSVLFGDVAAASVGDPTSTGVTAVVPVGLPLGGVPITVTTEGGTAVSEDVFTVQGLPPIIDGFTPTRGRSEDPETATPGTSITITGNHFASPAEGGTSVRLGDQPAEVDVDDITVTRIPTRVPPIRSGNHFITVKTRFGEAESTVPFVVVPKPAFNASNQLSPAQGPPGTTVTLRGRNFNVGIPEVMFGDVASASVGDPTLTGVTAVVPVGLPLGGVPVTVITEGGTAVSDDIFTVQGPPPQLDRCTPTQGRSEDPTTSTPGTVVTITGRHFEVGTTTVRFGNVEAAIDDITGTRISTKVPNVGSGNQAIRVATQFGPAPSTLPFLVLPKPAFNASNQLSPAQGPPGTTVTLRGRNFNVGVPRVMFGDVVAASAGNPTPTGVTAVVPVGLPLGGVPVTVTTEGGTAVSDDVFTVQGPPPQLDGCSPTQGRSEDPRTSTPGTIVMITGKNFEIDTTTVRFGNVQAVIDGITGTRISTKVPVVEAGNQVISVATQFGPAPSTLPFVVLPNPAFNASPNQFSPKQGPPGLSVTLFGRNFNVGTPRVMFGNVQASVRAATATGVTAVVPSGLRLGGVQITITTDGGRAVSDDLFTVEALPPKISRFTPPRGRPEIPGTRIRGTIVTIIGTDFEAGATLKFGDKEAVADSITSTRIRVKVPIIDGGRHVIAVSTQRGQALSATPFDAVKGNPTYVVRRGDTLGEIAQDLGVSRRLLERLNPEITNPNIIEVGQVINIPLTYVVERGDTMSEIAVTFRLSLEALRVANPQIGDINRIEVGQVIIIPLP